MKNGFRLSFKSVHIVLGVSAYISTVISSSEIFSSGYSIGNNISYFSRNIIFASDREANIQHIVLNVIKERKKLISDIYLVDIL
jgi:hypothetical protein